MIVIFFFATLNANPRALYAPSDFKNEQNFVSLLRDADRALGETLTTSPEMQKRLEPVKNLVEEMRVLAENPRASFIDARDCPAPGKAALPVIEYAGEDHHLLPGKTIIGRGKSADIVIIADHVSRIHALIIEDENDYSILDLRTLGGTYVNDIKVGENPVRLCDQDIIRFANVQVIYKHPCRARLS